MRFARLAAGFAALSSSAWAQRPVEYGLGEGVDAGMGRSLIVATIAFLALLWAFGAKEAPLEGFANRNPGWTVAIILLVPVLIGLLFK